MPDTGGDDYPNYGIIYPGDSDALTRLIRPNFTINLTSNLIQSPFPSLSLEAGSLDPVTVIDLYSEDTENLVPAAISDGLFGLNDSTMSIKPNAGRVISGGYLMVANIMPNTSDWSVSLALSYEVNDATQTVGFVSAKVSKFGSLSIITENYTLASATVAIPLKESILTLAWDGKDRLRASYNGVAVIASIDGLPSLYGAVPSLTVTGNVAKSFTGSITEGLTNQSPSGSSRGALYGQIVIDGESVMWPIGDSQAPRSDSDGVFNAQTESWAGTSLEAAKTALADESIPSLVTIAYCPSAFVAAPSESADEGNWDSVEDYGGDPLSGTSDLTPPSISVDFGADVVGFQGIYKPYPTEPSRKLVGLRLEDVTIETMSEPDPIEYLGDFVDGHDNSAFLVSFLAGSDFSADGGGLSLLFDDLDNDSMSIAGVQLSNAEETGLTVVGCRLLGVDVQSSVSISEIQLKVLAIDIEGAEVSGTSVITGDGSADWDSSVSLASTELISVDPADPVDIELLWGSASANAVIISCYGLPLEDPVPATPAIVVTPDSITITSVEWLYEVAPFKVDFILGDGEGNGVSGSSSVSAGNANWVESPNYAIATLDSSNAVIPVCDISFSLNNPNDGVRTAAIVAYADPPHPISVSFSSAVWLFSSSNVALPEPNSIADFASEVAQISSNFSEVIFWKDSGLTSGAYDSQNEFEDYISVFEAITSDSFWNPLTTELHGPNVHLKARGDIYDTTYFTSDASPYSFTVDSRDMDFLMDFIEAGQAATPTVGYSSIAFSAEFETAEEWIGLLRYVKEALNTGVRIIISTIFNDNVKTVNVKEIVDTFNEELTGFDVAFVSSGVSSPTYAIRSGDGTAGPMEDGVPSDTDGYAGDFYIDTDAVELYGPKGLSTWGSPLSLDFPSLTKSLAAPVDLDTLWFRSNTFVNYLDLSVLPNGPVPYETNGYGIEDPSAIISATYFSNDATPVSGSVSIVNGSLAVAGPSSQLFPTGGKLFFKTLDFADGDNGEMRVCVALGDMVTGTTFGDTIMSLAIGNYYLNNPIVSPLSGINQYDNLTLSLSIIDAATTRLSLHCNESTSATPTDFLDSYDIDRVVDAGDVLSIVSDGSSVFSVELNGELIIDASGWGYTGIINDLNKVSIGLNKAASTSYFATIRSVYVLQGPHINVTPQSLLSHNGVVWTPLAELSSLGRSEFYNPVPSFGSYAWEFKAYLESPKALENVRLKIISYSEDIMYNGIVHISDGDNYEQSFEFSEPGKIGYIGDMPIDPVTHKGNYTVTIYGDAMKSGLGFLRMSIAADNMSSIVVSDNIYIKENNG